MFRRILLWFGGMLVFSFAAYVTTSFWLASRSPFPGDMGRRMTQFQLEEAVRAYQGGGAAALRELIGRLDEQFPAKHFLIDAQGRDLASGQDLSQLATQAPTRRPPRRFPFPPPRRFIMKDSTADGRYSMLVEGRPMADPWANLPVYGWIVLVILLLCYALAWTLARPIRALRQTVVRFGNGDFSSRSRLRRNDDLGELARSFDQMADRIETLLTAERRLLQDISHELRSPLARLRFALQLAKSNPEANAFSRVDREVERLATLIGELLQVTRAEGDPASQNREPIDVRQILGSLVDDCRIEAEACGCAIDLFIKDDLTWTGDRELLHRAVENVLRNAIYHAPQGSSVDVDAATEDGSLLLQVRDYGPGVSEEHLPNIFRPFYRAEADRGREQGGGVGLGLAIAERAVRLHHGRIAARNAGPGLLVEIRLPL